MGNFLTIWVTISFSKETLLHVVCELLWKTEFHVDCPGIELRPQNQPTLSSVLHIITILRTLYNSKALNFFSGDARFEYL